jgi:glycine dehydrogenase
MVIQLNSFERFEARHNGSSPEVVEQMLQTVGVESLDELIEQTIPASIRKRDPLQLPEAQSEYEFLETLKEIARKNAVAKSYIGMGYHDCITPGVVLRNVLENPGWYTAYTPYQAEIAQGRLEMLINFQTLICDLTGLELANASLLDEATAAAEAMSLMFHSSKRKGANRFLVSDRLHPQTIDLLKTRSEPMGIELLIGNHEHFEITDPSVFGVIVQYPATDGEVIDYTDFIAACAELGIKTCVAADLLSLVLLKSPGEMGADVAVGSAQRFGVPMGYGGPHAAFFATKTENARLMPGRIIGLSKDTDGNPAYRMALQTREQHIKRDRATSNICTAQVLLSVMAASYAVYHGPNGLKNIAKRILGMTALLKSELLKAGFSVKTQHHFDTLTVATTPEQAQSIRSIAEARWVNFRFNLDGSIGVSLNEATSVRDLEEVIEIFVSRDIEIPTEVHAELPAALERKSSFMTHPVFNTYHNEHDMLRYLKYLENKDLSLTHSMIALGSCTMKLNATAEMMPVTWAEFGALHPFAPLWQAEGYRIILEEMEAWLAEITGFAGVSLQPNSGAQGEYAGLMVIRAYHLSRGDHHRNIALIPSSAHGTNPASAVMAGMQVVVVKCDERGNVDLEDLRQKAEQNSHNLAALMVTYPSTHGVFEEDIREICQIIHHHGGQVYMDGANMNAQVGLTSPALIGADVCHLNLHKTFCIPHGGGGPGMGPICVAPQLVPFLPGHTQVKTGGEQAISAVSAAPFGSASILLISYAYISMMGGSGLTQATKMAILNANYIKERLAGHYPVLYTGKNGRAAHEMILDCRGFKKFGIEVEDIAKRLMDYGFHAPTVSFPVAGTLMIEPTESESKAELDRFCDAMIAIRAEIAEIESGIADSQNNVLKNAPHTAAMVTASDWKFPYSREKAAYPLSYVRKAKFWPSVRRVDSAYGDRNLYCTCAPVEEYAQA